MFTTLNILIILLVLLIAYWWANQGLFSAILHCVCVVTAGAIALGLWEIVTINLFLTESAFDYYAWGVVLLGLFIISLVLLRVIADKTAPANVELPQWANIAFGFPIGAFAGIITMGIFLIGAGHMQSYHPIMGFEGWQRNQRGTVVKANPLWLPVHTITTGVYDYLSVGAMWTPDPLRHENPHLDRQVTLVRDTYDDGQAQVSMPKDAVDIERIEHNPATGGTMISVRFNSDARDFREQLALSASQIRLIGRASGFDTPDVHHPTGWIQENSDGQRTRHRFDDRSHYITSIPGRESADVVLFFERTDATFRPRYLQIRATRFELPAINEVQTPVRLSSASPNIGRNQGPVTVSGAAASIDQYVEIDDSVRPLTGLTPNNAPSGIGLQEIDDEYFITETSGRISVSRSFGGFARRLAVRNYHVPEGTKMVKVRVDRQTPANIYDIDRREQAGEGASVYLVDTAGNRYSVYGYLQEQAANTQYYLRIEPSLITSIDELPTLPTGSDRQMWLFFSVTEGAQLQALMLGDVTLGTMNVAIPRGDDRP